MKGSVVDADGHVLEPMSVWAEVPEQCQLRVSRDQLGLDHVVVGDQEIVTVSLGLLGTPGSRAHDFANSPHYEEAQPGGFDPTARLADMNVEGIDSSTRSPSGLTRLGADANV